MIGNSTPTFTAPGGVVSVTTLKQMVSRLTATELDELFKHVTILRRLSGTNKFTPTTNAVFATETSWQERILYDALSSGVAKQLGHHAAMPLGAFRRTPIHSQWHQAVIRALEQHRQWFPSAERLQTISMLRLYADMIIGNLNSPEHAYGFGWRSVCWGLENLAVIVDKNFPDYISNGMLPLVAKLRTAPPPNQEEQIHEQ